MFAARDLGPFLHFPADERREFGRRASYRIGAFGRLNALRKGAGGPRSNNPRTQAGADALRAAF